MSSNKKRKLNHIDGEVYTPSLPYPAKLHTPYNRRILLHESPTSTSKQSYHNHSHGPSTNSRGKLHRSSPAIDQDCSLPPYQLQSNRVQPAVLTERSSTSRHPFSHRHGQNKRDNKPNRQQFHPTVITPPIDHTRTSSFREAIKAQNRQRSRQHETFAAVVSRSSESGSGGGPEIPSSVKDSVEDDRSSSGTSSETSDDAASDSDQEVLTSSDDPDTESEEEFAERSWSRNSDSNVSEDSDSEAEILHRGTEQKKYPAQKEKSHVKPAVMGKELLEQQHREKAKIEDATKRAIDVLTHPKRVTTTTTNSKKSRQTTTPPTLSPEETTALNTLYSLVPPHIQQRAHTVLLQKQQPPRQSQPAHSATHPTPILTKLTSAHLLILHLSKATTSTSTTDPPTSTNTHPKPTPSTVQSELLRIIKEREQTIERLENEITHLKATNKTAEKEMEEAKTQRKAEREERRRRRKEKK